MSGVQVAVSDSCIGCRPQLRGHVRLKVRFEAEMSFNHADMISVVFV